jgi:ElaB/YqjD/DUF883 family membrane-anchored ribosome-binding protein
MNAAVVDLFEGVDDLLRRVADTECLETRKVRARVHAALVAARHAFVEAGPDSSPPPVEPPAALEDDMMQEVPTPTLGAALLLGLGIGFMTDSSH